VTSGARGVVTSTDTGATVEEGNVDGGEGNANSGGCQQGNSALAGTSIIFKMQVIAGKLLNSKSLQM